MMQEGPAKPPGKHDHVVIETDEGMVVTFQDHRRFGMMDLFPADEETSHKLLKDITRTAWHSL